MNQKNALELQKLVTMIERFITGDCRTRDSVRDLESCFAACGLDDAEELADLQLALAMFGAGSRREDEDVLERECRYALKTSNK
jgi:hypothetical protein